MMAVKISVQNDGSENKYMQRIKYFLSAISCIYRFLAVQNSSIGDLVPCLVPWSVSDQGTRSPMELFWTANNFKEQQSHRRVTFKTFDQMSDEETPKGAIIGICDI